MINIKKSDLKKFTLEELKSLDNTIKAISNSANITRGNIRKQLKSFEIDELKAIENIFSGEEEIMTTGDDDYISIEFGGHNPGNVLQDFTFDPDGRIYTTHDPSPAGSSDDAAVISKLSPDGERCPVEGWCEEGTGSHNGIVTPHNGWTGFGQWLP